MLNYLWGYMILIGIGFGILTGEVEALSNAAIDSTGEKFYHASEPPKIPLGKEEE